MNNTPTRDRSLDLIRSLAIILVCFVHAVNRIYTFTLKGMSGLSAPSFVFGNMTHALGQMGVPLFFMLTGYLLLSREYNTPKEIFSFWKKKLLPLVICFEIWTVAYWLMYLLQSVIIDGAPLSVMFTSSVKDPRSLVSLAAHMLMLAHFDIFRHMWYLPVIIGIYIVLPFFSVLLHKLPAKVHIFPLLVGCFYFFIVPTANIFFDATVHSTVSARIDFAFVGTHSGLYVLFGYFFKTCLEPVLRSSKKRNTVIALSAVGALISVLLTGLMMCFCYKVGYATTVPYNFVMLPFFGVSVFSLAVLTGDRIPLGKVWESVSKASFGMYFIHYPILLVLLNLYQLLKKKGRPLGPMTLFEFPKPLAISVLFAVIFLSSWGITVLISHFLPSVAKVLFLRKTESKKDMPAGEKKS
ncbi:MAG: acyltransferase [Lachnospiraceae bacterium]|nr:acyltransferase [Lachnospiraceae bacterium]